MLWFHLFSICICIVLCGTEEIPATASIVCELKGTVFEDCKPENTLTLRIQSKLINMSSNLIEYDGLVKNDIPIYRYSNGIKIFEYFNTKTFKFYKGYNEGHDVSARISGRNHEHLFISISSTNASYDISLAKNNYGEVYEGKIRIFTTNNDESVIDSTTNKLSIPSTNHRSKRSTTNHVDSNAVKYLELYIIYDFEVFKALGSNVTKSVTQSIDIVNALDTIYRKYNLRVILAGLEVWSEKNQINITSSSDEVLKQLRKYSKNILHVDNIHLLTTARFDSNVLGLAYVGVMCSIEFSCALSRYDIDIHSNNLVATMAHEIGHNLNMYHDDSVNSNCACAHSSGYCLMHSISIKPPLNVFSQCSIDSMNNYLQNSELSLCLSNKPNNTVGFSHTCGNNIIEGEEECDCGSPYFCTNKCCDPYTCKFTTGSKCSQGPCCYQCQFLSNQTKCRSALDECDLSDYCDGVSVDCPNVYLNDGKLCSGNGVCISGKCISRDQQCRYLWGSGAESAPNACYIVLNKKGKYYGHCGVFNRTTFIPCTSENTLCGKLHCENVTKGLFPVVGFTSGYSHVNIRIDGIIQSCSGGTADMGRGQQSDPGLVSDWTPCGSNKYCFAHKCVEKLLRSNCNSTCSQNEICANNGLCTCSDGLTGPNCNISLFNDNFDTDENIKTQQTGGTDSSKPNAYTLCYLIVSLITIEKLFT